ncbi:TonB-dependent receptor domain-containing protein [Sphingomonas colocasiae]|uniref:TonB-dependent receptor n=1 Tax=Sphingomonas colocasiae TaxID=1848973 RepID=A0ABS7PV34_9SPHN|nr:TonB-dependent receptor [Sphingomonas colocasiae]MBY8825217.1 TonB-dependent receptor [Sphingomonas colocasiae]
MTGISRIRLMAGLLAGAALTGALPPPAAQAQAQKRISIPAQSLDSALHALMDATGIQITYSSALSAGKRSAAVSGDMSATAALSRLLDGTGLSYRQTGTRAFTLEAAPQAGADGATLLGTLRVEGAADGGGAAGTGSAGWDGTPGTEYRTPGSVAIVRREVIERFPGTSPADLLKSAPGVFSGEARGSGGLNPNVRGLQGQGRVAVTVDGTTNGTTVYRGYQGIGSRTYVDRDFIGSIAIEKGPATGPGGTGAIGGTVAMTTITPDDIVAEGASIGIRLKGSLTGNTTGLDIAYRASKLGDDNGLRQPIDRPGALSPTAGSASIALGIKSDLFDLVGGFSHRRAGNYHAGTNGKGAPRPGSAPSYCIANPEWCGDVLQWYAAPGRTRFVGGEEVLNTSNETKSGLVKATVRFAPDHALELSYAKYVSKFGENYPASIYRNTDTVGQGRLSTSDLDRYAARYAWDPASELIHLKADAWATDLVEASQALGNGSSGPKFVKMRGGEISNRSRVGLGGGEFVAEYGLQYLYEKTGPVAEMWDGIPGREGSRNETSAWLRTRLAPAKWLMVDGGFRYTGYRLHDKLARPTDPERKDNALGFSFGATVEPVDGLQFFASYRDAVRMPALLEATRGFIMSADPALRPERAHDWEFGANFSRRNALSDGDDLGLKLVYFDNDIEDYISRRYNTSTYSMFIFNIDRAKFAGVEAALNYKTGGFSLDASATRYTDIAFCRRAEPCKKSSLAADYATNHIPPEFSLNLLLTQKLFDERLTLSGRLSHVGKRTVPFEVPAGGASPFISAIPWDPYTTVDLFASARIAKGVDLELGVENVGDVYYVEPLSLGLVPAPGRTVRLGITAALSPATNDGAGIAPFWSRKHARAEGSYDWTGFHIGASGGYQNGGVAITGLEIGVNAQPIEWREYELGDADAGIYGVQAGYTYQLNSLFALGVEGDYSWSKAGISGIPYTRALAQVSYDKFLSVRARAGVTLDRWFVYGSAGWVRADTELLYKRDRTVSFADSGRSQGYTAGGGVEFALADHIALRAEYRFQDMKSTRFTGTYEIAEWDQLFDFQAKTRLKTDQVRLGVNLRF